MQFKAMAEAPGLKRTDIYDQLNFIQVHTIWMCSFHDHLDRKMSVVGTSSTVVGMGSNCS